MAEKEKNDLKKTYFYEEYSHTFIFEMIIIELLAIISTVADLFKKTQSAFQNIHLLSRMMITARKYIDETCRREVLRNRTGGYTGS